MIKKTILCAIALNFSTAILCMERGDIWKLLNFWNAYTTHQKMMENRPNTKLEWETIVDKKIEHLIKTMQPTIENDDDRSYWEAQMEEINNSIHYRYKNNDPLAKSLALEKNGPVIAAAIICGFVVISRLYTWYSNRAGAHLHLHYRAPGAPPAYDAN